jgi:hypothetical protein
MRGVLRWIESNFDPLNSFRADQGHSCCPLLDPGMVVLLVVVCSGLTLAAWRTICVVLFDFHTLKDSKRGTSPIIA